MDSDTYIVGSVIVGFAVGSIATTAIGWLVFGILLLVIAVV